MPRFLLPVALAAIVVLSGCGDDKSSPEDDATVLKITAAQPASGQYRFDVPKSTKSGLTKIEFHNEDKFEREAQLVRIEGNHSIDEVLAKERVPTPDWQNVSGGVGTTAPGKTRTSFQNLPPGKYAVVDTNSNADRRPYFRDGAVAPFEVTGAAKTDDLPKANATIKLEPASPGFTASGTFKTGSNQVLVDNVSKEPCNLTLTPLLSGKTTDDVRKYLESDRSGTSPMSENETIYFPQLESETGEVSSQVGSVDLESGKYIATCYLTTRVDGPSPADRGFFAEIETAGSASAPAEEGAEQTTLRITASRPSSGKYEIELPSSTKGGLEKIVFRNDDKVVREAQLIRIDGDHSADEVSKAIDKSSVDTEETPTPEWIHYMGGVGTTDPGKTNTTIQNLPAGKYYVVDTNKDDEPDSPQYFKVGAIAPFEVTAGKDGELPNARSSITLQDDAPGVDYKGLVSEANTVLIDNTGSATHQVVALPILPGNTLADVKEFFTSDRPGAATVDFAKGTRSTQIEGGMKQVVDLDLLPEKYALLCFSRDQAGGPRHTDEGIAVEANVLDKRILDKSD